MGIRNSMNILTVTELNNIIKGCLDSEPLLQSTMVSGEISNCKQYPSGHWYFSLKDEGSAIRCVMFKREAASLRFRPENGMKVIAEGRVSVFPRDGAYQLYCTRMQPDGVGDLHVAYEQLVKKLGAEGLFDKYHKKPLTRYPERIALITSGAGAAVRDMIRILGQRYPLAKVIVMPVRVQGKEAPPEIVGAIRYANKYDVADLIITGRGGGSIEDLWAFNEEIVARAIFASRIPVISAVGHEPDVTISDFVADVRASTPSNGAELAVPDNTELYGMLDSYTSRLATSQQNRVTALRKRLTFLASSRALSSPMNMVQDRRAKLNYLSQTLRSGADASLAKKRQKFASLAASLDALSPLKVLGRGYSVVKTENGTLLKDADNVKIGDTVKISLSRGSVSASVTGVNQDKE